MGSLGSKVGQFLPPHALSKQACGSSQHLAPAPASITPRGAAARHRALPRLASRTHRCWRGPQRQPHCSWAGGVACKKWGESGYPYTSGAACTAASTPAIVPAPLVPPRQGNTSEEGDSPQHSGAAKPTSPSQRQRSLQAPPPVRSGSRRGGRGWLPRASCFHKSHLVVTHTRHGWREARSSLVLARLQRFRSRGRGFKQPELGATQLISVCGQKVSEWRSQPSGSGPQAQPSDRPWAWGYGAGEIVGWVAGSAFRLREWAAPLPGAPSRLPPASRRRSPPPNRRAHPILPVPPPDCADVGVWWL